MNGKQGVNSAGGGFPNVFCELEYILDRERERKTRHDLSEAPKSHGFDY
jgi:hypothetical protein